MKRFVLFFTICSSLSVANAQKPIDSSFNNTYYQGRMELFQSLQAPAKSIVFLGNSITERGAWNELLPGKKVMNRGIGGDNSFGVLARLDDIVAAKPKKVFLLIGINDLGRGLPIAVIANNYKRIVDRLHAGSPKTRLYLQSVLPLNDTMLKAAYLKNKTDSIILLNQELKKLEDYKGVHVIDLHPVFSNGKGQLKEAFTMDGIHLKPAAYKAWVEFLKQKHYL